MSIEKISKLPNLDYSYYLLLTDTSVHIPGDQRSQEAPGHGYPAHNHDYVLMEAFTDIDELKVRITELSMPIYGHRKEFKVLRVSPVEVGVDISVKVDGLEP